MHVCMQLLALYTKIFLPQIQQVGSAIVNGLPAQGSVSETH